MSHLMSEFLTDLREWWFCKVRNRVQHGSWFRTTRAIIRRKFRVALCRLIGEHNGYYLAYRLRKCSHCHYLVTKEERHCHYLVTKEESDRIELRRRS